VQGALVRRLVLHWSAFVAVASVVAFCLQVLSNPFRPLEQHFQELWWTHGPFLMVMFFMLPVFIVDTIKLSHRFAGPIYRLRNTVRSLAQGERFQPIKFREFDFWQGLAEDFNAMMARFSGEANEAEKPAESERVDDEPVILSAQ
jgi:nitrogen fixation/metabolism regulation signal transduction histidine kinase